MYKLHPTILVLIISWSFVASGQDRNLLLGPDLFKDKTVLSSFSVDNNWLGEGFSLVRDDKTGAFQVLYTAETSGIPGPITEWLDVTLPQDRRGIVRYAFTKTELRLGRKIELQFYFLKKDDKHSLYLFDRLIGAEVSSSHNKSDAGDGK